MAVLEGVERFTWERLLRRIDVPASTKYLGLTLATYANKDGSNVRPSVERLMAVSGTSKRTVLRAMKDLRGLGLIELVSRSNRVRGLADVYRLTLPHDLIERCALLPPDELRPEGQGADVAPNQGADVAPNARGSSANEDPVKVPCGPGQGAVVTRSGATSAPPPIQDHPQTRSLHQLSKSSLEGQPQIGPLRAALAAADNYEAEETA